MPDFPPLPFTLFPSSFFLGHFPYPNRLGKKVGQPLPSDEEAIKLLSSVLPEAQWLSWNPLEGSWFQKYLLDILSSCLGLPSPHLFEETLGKVPRRPPATAVHGHQPGRFQIFPGDTPNSLLMN